MISLAAFQDAKSKSTDSFPGDTSHTCKHSTVIMLCKYTITQDLLTAFTLAMHKLVHIVLNVPIWILASEKTIGFMPAETNLHIYGNMD